MYTYWYCLRWYLKHRAERHLALLVRDLPSVVMMIFIIYLAARTVAFALENPAFLAWMLELIWTGTSVEEAVR